LYSPVECEKVAVDVEDYNQVRLHPLPHKNLQRSLPSYVESATKCKVDKPQYGKIGRTDS
jgi:hypothetical protein